MTKMYQLTYNGSHERIVNALFLSKSDAKRYLRENRIPTYKQSEKMVKASHGESLHDARARALAAGIDSRILMDYDGIESFNSRFRPIVKWGHITELDLVGNKVYSSVWEIALVSPRGQETLIETDVFSTKRLANKYRSENGYSTHDEAVKKRREKLYAAHAAEVAEHQKLFRELERAHEMCLPLELLIYPPPPPPPPLIKDICAVAHYKLVRTPVFCEYTSED